MNTNFQLELDACKPKDIEDQQLDSEFLIQCFRFRSISNPSLRLLDPPAIRFLALDNSTKDLASILAFLSEDSVPFSVLDRLCQPRRSLSVDGKPMTSRLPGLSTIFSTYTVFQVAIKTLLCTSLLTTEPSLPSEMVNYFLDSTLRHHIKATELDPFKCQMQALRVIFTTFPIGGQLEPNA